MGSVGDCFYKALCEISLLSRSVNSLNDNGLKFRPRPEWPSSSLSKPGTTLTVNTPA